MFLVYDKDMNLKPFPKGIKPLDIYIPSMAKSRTTSNAEGSNKRNSTGTTYSDRPIRIEVGLIANNTQDYRLLRDVAYAFFDDSDYFYVVEKYQPGKRYRVTSSESFIPERLNRTIASLSINLETYDLYYSESIGTTQDIERDGIDVDSGLWGYGMGLEVTDESLNYTHNTNAGSTFRIFNAGNVPIHPFEQDFKMTISNVAGSNEIFQITNLTNGTKSRVNIPLRPTDTVVYDGPDITRNKLEFSRDTRMDFVELDPGWNTFQIYYCESAKVSFDFRYYYK